MKKTIKSFSLSAFRITAYTTGVVLALAIVAVLVVESVWFKNYLRTILVQEVNKTLIGELSVGKISGDLFTGIGLDNIRISTPSGEILSMDKLEVHFRLLALLYRKVSIRSLTLTGPKFTFERDSEGLWNVAALFKRPSINRDSKSVSSLPWTIAVRNLTIRNGTVYVDAGAANQSISFTGLNGEIGGRVKIDKIVSARLNIRDLSAEIPDKKITLRHLGAAALWDGVKGTLKSCDLETAHSSITAHGFYQTGKEPRLNVSIEFSVSTDELTKVTGRSFSGGVIDGAVSADGSLRAIAFEQRLAWQDMRIDSKGILNVVLPSIVVKVRARNLNPSRLAGIADKNTDAINAEADVRVKGKKLSTMDASITLSASNSQLRNAVFSRAALYGSLRQGILISSAVVDMSAGSLTAIATGTVSGLLEQGKAVDLAVSGNIARVNLSAFYRGAPESALNAMVAARISRPAGPREALLIETALDIGSSTVKGIAVYPSRIAGEYRAPEVTIKEAKIESELGQLRLDGKADIHGGISADYDIRSDGLDRLNKLLPDVRLSGSAVLNGTLSGSVKHPAVTLKLDGKDIGISSAAIAAVSIQATVNDIRKAESGPASIAMRTTGIVYGKIKIEKVEFNARRSSDTAIINIKAAADSARGALVSGSVTTEGWTLKKVHVEQFEIHNGTVSWQNDLPLDLRSLPGGWEVKSFALSSSGGQQIVAFGATRGDTLNYTVRVDSVNIAEIGAIAGLNMPSVGLLKAAVTLSGVTSSPIIAGSMELNNEGSVSYPFSRLAAVASYSDEVAQVLITLKNKGAAILTADGDIPVRLSFAPLQAIMLSSGLDVRVTTAHLAPALFGSLIRGIEKADADIRGDLSISGDPHDPSLNGQVSVDSGTLTLSSTGVEYSKITARVSIVDNTIILNSFSMRGGDGTADARGKAILAGMGLERFDLTVACHNFKAMAAASMGGTLDADLRWQGSLDDHDVTGSLTLLNGYYKIPETTRVSVNDVEIVENPGSSAAVVNEADGKGRSIFDGMNMDAKLRVPGSFWVRGRGVNAELKGNLVFRKSLDSDILISGTVQTVRGTYVFRQRTLNLTEGTVTFSGSSRIDPFLNIKASGNVSEVFITIVVGGTLSTPEIALQSTPAMDQSDILSYLLFGRPTNKLSQSEGSALQNTTVSVVGDVAIKGLRDVLGSDLAPDVIDVSPDTGGGIGVGKYLNDRLFVKYEWNIGPENLSQTTVEYEINRFFNLRSQAGNEKTNGLDLLWRYDY